MARVTRLELAASAVTTAEDSKQFKALARTKWKILWKNSLVFENKCAL